jgi:hypothetical protein
MLTHKQNPKDYDGNKIIARLSFGREFSARSWAQVSWRHNRAMLSDTPETDCSARQIHSIDVERLQSACQESEMRQRIHGEPSKLLIETTNHYLLETEIIASFTEHPKCDFLIP